MKLRSISRHLAATSLACLLALSVANCESDAPKGVGDAGDAGDAGSAGQPPIAPTSLCGHVAAYSTCDPLTASPCNVAGGQTCDYDFGSGTFHCESFTGLSSSDLSKAGGICGEPHNCGPTVTCNIQIAKCQHFCCSDSDCENHSACVKPGVFVDGDAEVGVCASEFIGEGGAGGTTAESGTGGEPAGAGGQGGG